MTIRSPQHSTKAGQETTWSFYVGSKLVEIAVTPDSHALLLSLDPTTQQKKLEELHYGMQAAAATQDKSPMSPTFGLGQSTPLRGAVAEGREGGWGTGATHSQTTPIIGSGDERRGIGAAEQERIIPPRFFASPIPEDKELELIRSRLENLSTSMRQPATEHHDALNWTYTAQEHQQHEEQKACTDRRHEFEQRTKQFLSLPAKRFTAAYNSCIFHFKRNVNTLISKELISELMDELDKQYQETSKARDYCMEVLSQEDLNFNPKYEEYMTIKLDQFNECRQLRDQYVAIHQQELQLPQRSLQAEVGHQARHHGPDSTGTIPKVPQLNKELLSNVQEGKGTLENITPISKCTSRPGAQFQTEQEHTSQYHQPSSHTNQHHEQGTGGNQHSNQHHEQDTGGNQHSNQHHEQGTGGHQQSNQQHEQDTRRSQQSNRHSTQNEHGTEAEETQNQDRNRNQNEEHHRRRFFREENEENLNASVPPTGLSGNTFTQHQFRFKLDEELGLVSDFDASNPKDYMAFRAQWTNFERKMVNSGRSQEDLYCALLRKLKGSARELCKNKYHDPEAYTWSIRQLDRLYNKPENLLRLMITKLLKTSKMDDTYESLLMGMSKLQEAWQDLNQANLTNEELKGLLFIAATEKSLSEGSWKCWLDIQNNHSGHPLSVFEARTYFGAIETALSNEQRRKEAGRSSSVMDKRPQPKPKQKSTLFGSYNTMNEDEQIPNNSKVTMRQNQARTKDGKCVFCLETPHPYQLWCPKLKTMPIDEIWQIIRTHKIFCQMCLGLGHWSNACPAAKAGKLNKCNVQNEKGQRCNRPHTKYLHQGSTSKSNNKTQQ